ncbi:hypothetical protein EAO71_22645 [Streptomyces sp. ms191]|uniref:hypothetical protein n=1 Tax=unclassified Streptomyces TaxID=2593676 RepID=UPI0011CDEF7A|nr:hypothetical protein [Streptomyces sp. ms191]TXS22995.1 hypothetical protein EAO71_22645 [Streptomyces sp. ms191]
MDLMPYVDNLRNELAVAAAAGGDDARALAERLTAPLESAARLTLLNALSAAMDEITSELAPGSVDVRLRGLDPEFVVTPPPAPEAYEDTEADRTAGASGAARAAAQPVADGDDAGTARINFRLPAPLKARIEEAAGQEGLSVNAWLVRAVAGALDAGEPPRTASRTTRPRGGRSYTGWAR